MAGELESNAFWLFGVQDDATSTGDGQIFPIVNDCIVLEAGVQVEGTEATTATIKFDLRPKCGSDTGRGDGDVANVILTAADNQGKQFFDLVAQGNQLAAGDQVVVQITTGSCCAKLFTPYLILRQLDEVKGNMADKVETA